MPSFIRENKKVQNNDPKAETRPNHIVVNGPTIAWKKNFPEVHKHEKKIKPLIDWHQQRN